MSTWQLWQVCVFTRDDSEVWTDLTGNPQWGTSAKYRRKPKAKRYLIVNINPTLDLSPVAQAMGLFRIYPTLTYYPNTNPVQ